MIKFYLSLIAIFSLLCITNAQDNEQQQVIEEQTNYEITDINQREETTIEVVNNVKRDIRKIEESTITNLQEDLDSLNNILSQFSTEYIESLSIIGLKNATSTLNGVSKTTKSLQNLFTSNIDRLTTLEKLLINEKLYWQNALDNIKESKEITQTLIERIEANKNNVVSVINTLTTLLNKELDNTNKVSAITTTIEEIKNSLEVREEFLVNSYLMRDSEPLWKAHKLDKDTTRISADIRNVLKENKETVNLYFAYNKGIMLTHLIIIIILFILFQFSKKISLPIFNSNEVQHLAIFSKKPLMSAYVYSFLLISLTNTGYPAIILEFYLITLFYPIYQLLKSYVKPENRYHIILFINLFTFEIFINYISPAYLSGRIILLILEIITLTYLIYLIASFRNRIQYKQRGLLYYATIAAAILFSISVITNFFGIVRLSRLLSEATINCIGIGMLVFLFYKISNALLIVLSEIKPFSQLNIIKERKVVILTWLSKAIRFILIILFIKAILKQYKLFKPFTNWWQEFTTKSWQLGEVSLSIGDFLNFFILVFVTIFIARFLKYLLGGEIIPHFTKKRGMPNAIATSVYYVVLVIGLFLAAFSTGIEWSKVNLALGALGVGIGFGLQNVVYNFIAGLILTYERPVQVGDIVQLKSLMGSIKDIGVRSSRVLTYDGAEVVVPNGNLISEEVINWTLSNNNKRQELKFKASTNANPQEVVEILKTVALKNPKVIQDSNPLSLFEGYGDGTLEFRLLFWTHVDVGLSTKSEVALAIYEELKQRGYELPVERKIIKIEGKENIGNS